MYSFFTRENFHFYEYKPVTEVLRAVVKISHSNKYMSASDAHYHIHLLSKVLVKFHNKI